MWSHWVKQADDFYSIFEYQTNTSNTTTMMAQPVSSRPSTPSTRMKHVLDLASRNVCGAWRGFEDGIPFYVKPATVVGPRHGIPGMVPLINNSWLADAIVANITALWYELGLYDLKDSEHARAAAAVAAAVAAENAAP